MPPRAPLQLRVPLVIAALWFMTGLFISGHSLRTGQINKQFHAWSITQSLAREGFNPLATSLPCKDPRTGEMPAPWAEEPPVFHSFAALGVKLGFGPAAVPLLLTFALMFGIACLTLQILSGSGVPVGVSRLAALAAASAPIFVRYQIQHLPDLAAATALIWACLALERKRRGTAILLGLIASAAKVFYALPFVFIFATDRFLLPRKRTLRTLIRTCAKVFATATLLLMPFLVWLVVIDRAGILNPFHSANVSESRHVGTIAVLFSWGYVGRFFNWTMLKGAGPVLFSLTLGWLLNVWRNRRHITRAESLLAGWLGSIPVFWLAVRSGNYVHDYYSLATVPPISILGAAFAAKIRNPLIATALLCLSLCWGIWPQARLALGPPPAEKPPTFCDAELKRHSPSHPTP